jgi:hypothetical protein
VPAKKENEGLGTLALAISFYLGQKRERQFTLKLMFVAAFFSTPGGNEQSEKRRRIHAPIYDC